MSLTLLLFLALSASLAGAALVDLTSSCVVAAARGRLPVYAETLVEQVLERAVAARWRVASEPQPDAQCVILDFDPLLGHEEGYHIALREGCVHVDGADELGVLFGVGRLLRLMNISFEASYSAPPRTSIVLDLPDAGITSWPRYRMRGHQLGYRPITNSYDGWTSQQFARYMLELSFFGTNTIELIPNTIMDNFTSPHYVASPDVMLVAVSAAAERLGMRVSLWYPAELGNYSDPRVLALATAEWARVFAMLPRLDAILVPGGDPGGHSPEMLFTLTRQQYDLLQQYHPGAEMWLSAQGFSAAELERFIKLLDSPEGYFVTGAVYGPWVRVTFDEFADMLPPGTPLRNYPDITHSLTCQLPVPNWDYPFALMQGRETINPRPRYQALIANHQSVRTIGFGGYSEGCNDDLNKCVWSAVHWGPDQPARMRVARPLPGLVEEEESVKALSPVEGKGPREKYRDSTPRARFETASELHAFVDGVVADYARVFAGPRLAPTFSSLLFGLEDNWVGPASSTKSTVQQTLSTAQDLESRLGVRDLFNWRLMQPRYRAYHDAIVRTRASILQAAAARAMEVLAHTEPGQTLTALAQARQALLTGEQEATTATADLRTALKILAQGLYQSIRMKLSVGVYGADFTERGANLDTINITITDAPFLLSEFDKIRALSSDAARLAAIRSLVNHADPGPGGFFDDLGNIQGQPHLVQPDTLAEDPSFYSAPLADSSPVSQQFYPPTTPLPSPPLARMSVLTYARTHFGGVLRLRYPIQPGHQYNVSITYVADDIAGGGRGCVPISLLANGVTVHHVLAPTVPTRTLSFAIPATATRTSSTLELQCVPEPLVPQEKSGCVIAEIWLRRS